MHCTQRYVPEVFDIARDNTALNEFLRCLVRVFPRAEREPETVVYNEATRLLTTFLAEIEPTKALVTARSLMQFSHWAQGEQWLDAIFSSMGAMTFEAWIIDRFPEHFDQFLRKYQFAQKTIEERGPRHDREAGVIVQAGVGMIIYVHPHDLQYNVFTKVYGGMPVIVPCIPPSDARLLRTQPNGTRIFALDLRMPEIR